jgi:hypothetical protein
MKTFIFIILCIGTSSLAFSSEIAWFRQPPYRYYWKKQRDYQRYQYNLQKQGNNQQQNAANQEPKPEENPRNSSTLTPAKLRMGSNEYEYIIKTRDLYEKKADSE